MKIVLGCGAQDNLTYPALGTGSVLPHAPVTLCSGTGQQLGITYDANG
jgi:hypothetical protein